MLETTDSSFANFGLKNNLILPESFKLTGEAEPGSRVSNLAKLLCLLCKVNNLQTPALCFLPRAGQVQFRKQHSCFQTASQS